MEDLNLQQTPAQRRVNILITVLLVLVVGLCLYVTLQVMTKGYVNLFGYSMFRVVTGSMEPTIPVGSLLISKQVPMESIYVGDIICFRARESAIFGHMMTHRVVEVYPALEGGIQFLTKGDANLSVDGYLVSQVNFVGKVIWHTGDGSFLATVFALLTNKIGFFTIIIFPCMVLASLILKDSVKNLRKELRELEREERRMKADPLLAMSQNERDEMLERIRTELIEELINGAENPKKQ